MPSAQAEAWGYALLLTRRVLTTSLAGLDGDRAPYLHEITPEGSLIEQAQEICAREAWWTWPADLPPARLDPPSTLVETLYALVRHRAVTEEILMRAEDATLAQDWPTAARSYAGEPPVTLGAALRRLAEEELATARRAASIRGSVDADWSPQPELVERAESALAAAVEVNATE